MNLLSFTILNGRPPQLPLILANVFSHVLSLIGNFWQLDLNLDFKLSALACVKPSNLLSSRSRLPYFTLSIILLLFYLLFSIFSLSLKGSSDSLSRFSASSTVSSKLNTRQSSSWFVFELPEGEIGSDVRAIVFSWVVFPGPIDEVLICIGLTELDTFDLFT